MWKKPRSLATGNQFNHIYLLNYLNRLQTGTVFMNACDFLDPALPWVGVKLSGRGCGLSRFSFDQVTRLKGFNLRHEL